MARIEGKNSKDDRLQALQNLGELKSLRAFAPNRFFRGELNQNFSKGKSTKSEISKSEQIISSVRKEIQSHKDTVEFSKYVSWGVLRQCTYFDRFRVSDHLLA